MSRAEEEDEADFEAARLRNTVPNHDEGQPGYVEDLGDGRIKTNTFLVQQANAEKKAMLDRAAESKLLLIPSHEL